MALDGVSSRLVHASGTSDSSSSAPSPVALNENVTECLVIGRRCSERDPEAARDGTGTRIAEIIDAAHTRALVAGLDFRSVTRIAGQQQQVVAGHGGPCTVGAADAAQGEVVVPREVLQAQVS